MANDKVCVETDGYIVLAIPHTTGNDPVPFWSPRWYQTKEEAMEGAEAVANQAEGYQAFVIKGEAYLYQVLSMKKPANPPSSSPVGNRDSVPRVLGGD